MLALFQHVLANNIAPAFLIIAVGFALDRAIKPHLQSISRLALYALTPSFVFNSLVTSELQGELITRIVAFAASVILGMTVISLVTARLLRLEQAAGSAFVLATTLTNAGNFGMSLTLFTYGDEGLELAIIYFVTSAVLANTVGAFIASRSSGTWRQSLLGVLRLPVVYAAVAAVTMRLLHYAPPAMVLRPIGTIGQAAVPVMLILLGMQLSRTHLRNDKRLVVIASAYKLVGMSLLAVALAAILRLDGLPRHIGIIESSTPTAVTAVLLATEFGARPDIVASTVLLSTLTGAITLTVILSLLG